MSLDPASIASLLADRDANLFVLDEIDSSNAEALRKISSIGKAESPGSGAFSVVARSQTAGRGRHGRSWMSEPGAGLYFSHARRFTAADGDLQALSLVTALAVAEVVRFLGVDRPSLKWPNDVLVDDRKLAGILLERKMTGDSSWIVFGIGINLQLGEQQRAEIGRPVCDLAELLSAAVDGDRLVAKLIETLGSFIDDYLRHGFAPFQSSWNAQDRYRGDQVVLDQGQNETVGQSCGVDPQGRLLLLTDAGERCMEFGELFPSLRANVQAAAEP